MHFKWTFFAIRFRNISLKHFISPFYTNQLSLYRYFITIFDKTIFFQQKKPEFKIKHHYIKTTKLFLNYIIDCFVLKYNKKPNIFS